MKKKKFFLDPKKKRPALITQNTQVRKADKDGRKEYNQWL